MIIYLDNYRGFVNQFIDTSELNILVGENSTGKSSFLTILSLLSSPDFLSRGIFKNEFVDLGPYDEIVNFNRKEDSIQIGIINTNEKNDGYELNLDGLMMKFESSSGYPAIKEVFLINNRSILWYRTSKKNITYILYEISKKNDDLVALFTSMSKSSKLELKVLDKGKLSTEQNVFPFLSRFIYSIVYLIKEFGSTDEKNIDVLYKDFLKLDSPLVQNNLLRSMIWVSPIRSEPKRIYEPSEDKYSPDGTHIANVLRNIFATGNNDNNETIKELAEFGKESGLFDEIAIKNYLKDQELSPFELNIILEGNKLRITNVGYGVSQSLPIITEVARRKKKSCFLIQQPEVHLHPKAQAQMGEFLFNECINNKKVFFIETHSDFIIDRIRTKTRESNKKDIDSKLNLLFFQRTDEGNTVTKIKIDKDGQLDPEQPKAYREFFLKEQLSILGLSEEE